MSMLFFKKKLVFQTKISLALKIPINPSGLIILVLPKVCCTSNKSLPLASVNLTLILVNLIGS